MCLLSCEWRLRVWIRCCRLSEVLSVARVEQSSSMFLQASPSLSEAWLKVFGAVFCWGKNFGSMIFAISLSMIITSIHFKVLWDTSILFNVLWDSEVGTRQVQGYCSLSASSRTPVEDLVSLAMVFL